MEWTTGLAVYAIVWWVVLLAVLPWGNRQIDAADVAKGQAWGSPASSRPSCIGWSMQTWSRSGTPERRPAT